MVFPRIAGAPRGASTKHSASSPWTSLPTSTGELSATWEISGSPPVVGERPETPMAGPCERESFCSRAASRQPLVIAELRESLDLPIRAAYCLARQGRAAEALTVLEQGRTRTLTEALDRREAATDRLPAADRRAFEIARNEVRRLEAQARSLDVDDPELLRVSETLGIARKALAQKLSSTAPGVLPPPLDAAEIQNLARLLGAPLAYLLTTRHGSLALIQPPYAPVSALFLHGFTSHEAGKIEIGGAGGREETMRALDAAWPVWRERLMLPLGRRLRRLGFEQAVLIPCGRLALWPLPATVMDHLRLTLAPSARLLLTARVNADARRSQSPSLLAVAHPGARNRFLPSAEIEAERIAAGLDSAHILRGPEATREAVVQALPGVTHLHFACHGSFDGTPLDSALELAGPVPLTLRDLLDGDLDLSSARLAVLSACDSGRIENRYLPDEALGLPAGFLQAGIPAVVSGLWEVDDLAATHLLSELYAAHLQRGLSLLDSLLAAQERLRTASSRDLGLAEHCREILSRPLPPNLRAAFYLRQRRAESHPEEVPFRHALYWGAYVVAGVG
jgi:CHAT domain-containing protein